MSPPENPARSALVAQDIAAIEALAARCGAETLDHMGAVAVAVELRAHASLRACLRLGADQDLLDIDHHSALHHAAARGDTVSIDALLQARADVDLADGEGRSALTIAAAGGHAAACERLLAAGADPNHDDHCNTPPLIHACAHAGPGRLATMRVLLHAGARANKAALQGHTALHAVAGHADADAALGLLIAYGADVLRADMEGTTALHAAASHANARALHTLLDAGADPGQRDVTGRTPIQCLPPGHEALSQALAAHYPRGLQTLPGEEAPSGLMGAVLRDDVAAIEQIVATHGHSVLHARAYSHDEDAIDLAVGSGRLKALRACLRLTPCLERLNAAGRTPLMYAVRAGECGAVRVLLKHGANPNRLDWFGDTAAHHACARGNLRALDLLIEHGAAIDALNDAERTPAQEAANFGHLRLAERIAAQARSRALSGVNESDPKDAPAGSRPAHSISTPAL